MADGLALLFTLKAKNEAAATIKSVETQIAQLKDRIKEVKKETDVPFKTQRLEALGASLKTATAQHKELSAAAKLTATAQQDLGSALSAVSPKLGGLVASLSGAVGPLSAVAVGLAAVGAAGVALFELTRSTAEFQGKMLDLSQQTGVAVETLSTLEIVAKTTGGNIEQVAASLFLFQQKLADAQDPTTKEAELLKTLGIQASNTEDAFRQAVAAIAAMPEGFQQSDAAAQLFGSRGGKQILAMLKEMNGDVDGATEKFRAMGILISGEAAEAADKFNDHLALLQFQVRAATALIGNEAMPEIGRAIESLSKFLTDNRTVIVGWTQDIGDAARGAGVLVGLVFQLSNAVGGLSNIPIPAVLKFLSQFNLLSNVFDFAKGFGTPEIGALPLGPGGATPVPIRAGGPSGTNRILKGGKGRTGGTKTDNRLQNATRDAGLAEREALLITTTDLNENKRAFEEQTRTIEEFTRRAIELNGQQLAATLDRIKKESDALDAALKRKSIKRDEHDFKQRELDLQAAKAQQENKDKEFQLERERNLQLSQARIAAAKRELEIAEETDQRAIRRIEDRIDEEVILESEGEEQIAAIIAEGFARRLKVLQEEEEAYATSLERRKDINAEIIRLDAERTESAEQAAKRIAQARFDEQNKGARGATRDRTVGGEPTDLFGELGKVASDTLGLGAQQAQAFGDIISSTMSQIGSAVGEAVHAFVLFGSVQGSFKKFAAELIASIAQMAAVQAIYELAQGLAMLALAHFFPSVKYFQSSAVHFAAAAMFGAVAGVTAVVGRAVAGNSFNQGGGGGGAGGGGTGATPADKPGPIDLNRTQRNEQIHIFLHGEPGPGFHDAIINTTVRDVQRNGAMRNLIIETAGGG